MHQTKENILIGRIVEVEAYTGKEDKGSHTYGGRRTARTEIMYQRAGHLYVYLIYGIHSLVNIVTGIEGEGEAVLIRAIDPNISSNNLNQINPVLNLNHLAQNRFEKNYAQLSSYQRKNLTNGPGKLTQAMQITTNNNGSDLLEEEFYLLDDGFNDFEMISSKRIGIDYAEEARDFLYRFYIKNNSNVSI